MPIADPLLVPAVIGWTYNHGISRFAAIRHSRVANIKVIFNMPTLVDSGAFSMSLFPDVYVDGVASPGGGGVVPTLFYQEITDASFRRWKFSWGGVNTNAGSDGISCLKDGVYEFQIDGTKIHRAGDSGVSGTTFTRPVAIPGEANKSYVQNVISALFGYTGEPYSPLPQPGPGGQPPGPLTPEGWEYLKTQQMLIDRNIQLTFDAAFPTGAGQGAYNAALDWNGDGLVSTSDSLKFRDNYGKTWRWGIFPR